MEKRITDWETGYAGWSTAPKLKIVPKTEPVSPVGPTLVPPRQVPSRASENTLKRHEVVNPLDCMTWEERFWFAFQAILELERDLEELQVHEELFRCLTCRREDGVS